MFRMLLHCKRRTKFIEGKEDSHLRLYTRFPMAFGVPLSCSSSFLPVFSAFPSFPSFFHFPSRSIPHFLPSNPCLFIPSPAYRLLRAGTVEGVPWQQSSPTRAMEAVLRGSRNLTGFLWDSLVPSRLFRFPSPPSFPFQDFLGIFIGGARDRTPNGSRIPPSPCVAESVLSTFHHFPSNSIRFPSFFVVAPIPGIPPSSLSLWFREDSGDTRNKCSQWQQDP